MSARFDIADSQAPRSGDKCPGCDGGWLVVGSSKRRGSIVVRYVECWQCGHKAGGVTIEAHAVPRRRPRKLPS
jgi:hypothetical protein